jgi:Tfp pilus assembly protein PilF
VIASLPPQPHSNTRQDGRTIPAVTHLLALGRQQLSEHQWDNAEQSFTQAQRLAPNNPAVYAYLSSIALQQQQAKRAEAMARHGLMLTRYATQQKAFWQLIQLAGQQQRLSAVVLEAEREIAKLP